MVEIPVDADRAAIEATVRSAVSGHSRVHGPIQPSVYIAEVEVEGRRFLKYDYGKWAREHLDIMRLKYVLDYDAPVAQTRNKELAQAIERALDSCAVSFRR
jgi:hypothetical protein